MDRGIWQATAHRVTKSQAWLNWLSTHSTHLLICNLEDIFLHWLKHVCSRYCQCPKKMHPVLFRTASEAHPTHTTPLPHEPVSAHGQDLETCPLHGLQHTMLPCPSPTPGACSNSCPSSCWCHPTILSSVIPFSSCLQLFPASGSFPVSQFFTSGSQSIGVSTSASFQWIFKTDFL